jgi:4-alpha-glucanotransferase
MAGEGLREQLACAAVLSYKVAWFERDAEGRLTDSRLQTPVVTGSSLRQHA